MELLFYNCTSLVNNVHCFSLDCLYFDAKFLLPDAKMREDIVEGVL